MTWRVLISAPYFLSVVEDFRSGLEADVAARYDGGRE